LDLGTKFTYDCLIFESTLAHVELKLLTYKEYVQVLPSSTGMTDLVESRNLLRKENQDSITGLMDWLWKKGVRRIIKLVVRDDREAPCSDETVESCLEGFDIRYLDWHKDDLDIQTIVTGQATQLTEIHLYCSGSNAVLRQWSSSEGLGRVREVCVH
jgi:hypothetical protein